MKNEYNDSQIMSPSIMEQIAKAYSQHLASLQKTNEPEQKMQETHPTPNHLNFYKQIKSAISTLNVLHKFCSPRFYATKQASVQSIINALTNLLPKPEQQFDHTTPPARTNFCELVKTAVSQIALAIPLAFNIFIAQGEDNSPTQNKKVDAFGAHSTLCELISKTVNLIGSCKFRQ